MANMEAEEVDRDKAALLENLRHGVYARIVRSTVHGVGVFAIKDIPKGVNPFLMPKKSESRMIELSDQELHGLDDRVVRYLKDFMVDKEGRWRVPECGLNGLDISWFMNHSDDPNMAILDPEDEGACFSLRPIRAGEELCYDYRTIGECFDHFDFLNGGKSRGSGKNSSD